MSKNKKKKQKTKYVDDGRTIVDMSGVGGHSSYNGKKGTPKEQMRTYFAAVKMMFFPMLATMAAIGVAFLILYLILELAA